MVRPIEDGFVWCGYDHGEGVCGNWLQLLSVWVKIGIVWFDDDVE